MIINTRYTTRVDSCSIQLDYEEIVQLCAALTRLKRHTANISTYKVQDTNYGQTVQRAPFLRDLHKTLKELTNEPE